MIARIYTQDTHRTWITDLIETAGFDSFTLIPARGFWKGEEEVSLIIEIITLTDLDGDKERVKRIAGRINEINKQQATLVLFSNGEGSLIIQKIKGVKK